MQKSEVYAFLLLVLAFSVLAVVNEPGQLRAERIQLGLGFPSPARGLDKTLAFRVRSSLLNGAKEDFFDSKGLSCDAGYFFDNELALFESLLQVMCLKPAFQEGMFLSPGGIHLMSNDENARFRDVGVHPCNVELAGSAESVFRDVADLDLSLVEFSLDHSECSSSVNGRDAFVRAGQNLADGDVDSFLTNLRFAWWMAVGCRC